MKEYHKIETLFVRDNQRRLVEGAYRNPSVDFLKNNEWVFTDRNPSVDFLKNNEWVFTDRNPSVDFLKNNEWVFTDRNPSVDFLKNNEWVFTDRNPSVDFLKNNEWVFTDRNPSVDFLKNNEWVFTDRNPSVDFLKNNEWVFTDRNPSVDFLKNNEWVFTDRNPSVDFLKNNEWVFTDRNPSVDFLKNNEWVFTDRNPSVDFLKNNEWVFTEKIDGTNIRIHWDGHKVSTGGRTDAAHIPAHLAVVLEDYFLGKINEQIFEQLFGLKEVTLYGEGFGQKIQNGDSYGPVDFALFDVMVGSVFMDNVEGIARHFNIKTAPVILRGTIGDAIDYVKDSPKSQIAKDSKDMEGLIGVPAVPLRNAFGSRIIVKIKASDFGVIV